MTLLPHENRNVKGLEGPAFPKYKVGPVCCVPGCSKFVDHAHHLWRRSFVGGDYCWVELWDHTIVGNLVGLCWRHHDQVTKGEVWMRWDDYNKKVVWDDNTVKYPPQIFPQPPRHAEPDDAKFSDTKTLHTIDGPGSTVVCPGCKRPIPKPKIEGQQRDMSRRRKTWTVKVPDDGEDGALVLDTLLEECATLFGQDMSEANLRYFVLVKALYLVIQNSELIRLSEVDGGKKKKLANSSSSE